MSRTLILNKLSVKTGFVLNNSLGNIIKIKIITKYYRIIIHNKITYIMKYICLILLIVLFQILKCDGKLSSRDVLDTVPLIDGHNDWPVNIRELVNNQLSQVDFRQNLTNDPVWGTEACKWCKTDIPRLRAGQLGAFFLVAHGNCSSQFMDAVENTLEQLDVIHRLIDMYNDTFEFVTTAQGIENTFAAGKISALIAIEGGQSIDSRLAVLRMYYQLGARYMTLTHFCANPWADPSTVDIPGETPIHNGITEFGKTVVHEMNRLGMIIDISHVSKQAQLQVLAETRAPVVFSHSSVWALCNSHRNVQDDVLLQLKANNGIIMINFYNGYVTCTENATIDDVIRHIKYVKNLIGVDYVGIGSDFEGVDLTPVGLEDVSKYPNLFDKLLNDPIEPWTTLELQKLAGLNFLRVFREIEAVRDQIAAEFVTPYETLIPIEDLGNNTYCMNLQTKNEFNDDDC